VARNPLLTNRTRLVLLAAYAVANFLSFPHPIGERVVDLGLLCGWLSPALLILGLAGQAPRAAAKTAFVAGTLAHSAILHWIYVVSVTYGHAAPPLGVIAVLGMGAHSGFFTAIFAAGWALLGRRGMASPWAAAALWVVVEYSRSAGPLGFPWAVIGYSQHTNPVLLSLAAYTGVCNRAGPAVYTEIVEFVTHLARRNRGDRCGWLPTAVGARPKRRDDSCRSPSGQHRARGQMESRLGRSHPLDL